MSRCHDCGEAAAPGHVCDLAKAFTYLKEQRADLMLVNERLMDLGLAQSRYWMGHLTKAMRAMFEARQVAWELWDGVAFADPDLNVIHRRMAEVFGNWRKEGWQPKGERKDDGKGKDEEERG